MDIVEFSKAMSDTAVMLERAGIVGRVVVVMSPATNQAIFGQLEDKKDAPGSGVHSVPDEEPSPQGDGWTIINTPLAEDGQIYVMPAAIYERLFDQPAQWRGFKPGDKLN